MDKIGREIDHEIDTVDGALEKYNLTNDRIFKIINDRVFSAAEDKDKKIDLKDLRHFADMIFKIRGNIYKPDTTYIDKKVVYRWEDSTEEKKEEKEEPENYDILNELDKL